MKNYATLLILSIIGFCMLINCDFVYKGILPEVNKPFKPSFYNGQILLPDYAHEDTLLVINADLLNDNFKYSDAGTDQEIFEILSEGTVYIADYPTYQDYINISQPSLYTLRLTNDSIYLMDKDKTIGVVSYNTEIGEIILNDNL